MSEHKSEALAGLPTLARTSQSYSFPTDLPRLAWGFRRAYLPALTAAVYLCPAHLDLTHGPFWPSHPVVLTTAMMGPLCDQ